MKRRYFIQPPGPFGLPIKTRFYKQRQHSRLGNQCLCMVVGGIAWINVPYHWILNGDKKT